MRLEVGSGAHFGLQQSPKRALQVEHTINTTNLLRLVPSRRRKVEILLSYRQMPYDDRRMLILDKDDARLKYAGRLIQYLRMGRAHA